jgi:hypothetical protein
MCGVSGLRAFARPRWLLHLAVPAMEPHEALPDWLDRLAVLVRDAVGYAVEAIDGTRLGTVEEVVWPAEPERRPQLRVHYGRISLRRRLVPLTAVRAVDAERRTVVLALGAAAFSHLGDRPEPPESPAAAPDEEQAPDGHLLFLAEASGYVLLSGPGEPPEPGALVERGERRYHVSRVGPSPLPGDPRPCAYLI